ncbi:MAG TPA: EAL domain-containing protein [Acidimicrobiales bacterium]|nr:EAL domain-containing protein [Acidimicrobiales bacterium]
MRTSFRTAAIAAAILAGIHVAWALTDLGGPTVTQMALRLTLLLAAMGTTAACVTTSRNCTGGARRGWWLFGMTATCWVISQAMVGARELTSGRRLEFPAPGDIAANVAIVFSVLAMLAFLGGSLSAAARMRTLLDGLLIAASLLFVSWASVLEGLYRSTADGPVRVLGVAYPMGDVVLVSLILVIAARAAPGTRLPWTILGTALGLFAVGHSSFAYLQLAGADVAPWIQSFSWLAGCLLVGLAALAFDGGPKILSTESRAGGKSGIFLPYVPLVLATAVAIRHRVDRGAPVFLAANGAVIVILLLARQLLAQLENLELTQVLEERVRSRTAALRRQERHFRAIAQNAFEVLTVVDASGIIRYQSASILRVLGHHPEDLIGKPLEELLAPEDRQSTIRMVTEAAPPPAVPSVFTTRLRRPDGSSCEAEITVSNLLRDDAVRGFVLTSRDISERSALEGQLRQQALHDPLTGLGNRTLFRDRLEHALARAERRPELLAVLMIDLDGFKQVNDSLGHDAGDKLLIEVARRLGDCIRAGDTVARMGGDEFAVLLERADVEGPEVVAQRIVYRLHAPVDIDGKAIVTPGSVGVALGSTMTMNAEELLRNADLAMYAAKSKGKGTYELFERQMHAAVLERVELEAELRHALRRHELSLHYQPVVELPSGRISGAEALARWHHPQRGMVSPGEFVPLAEESGLVVDLGRWVLGEACRQAKRFQEAYPTEPPFTMAVNVAARQLTSPWLVDEVRKALAESHLPASSLVLEITEGALMKDASSIVPTLEALRAIGVRLAIDDFGTGWSSLSRLRSFPVDKLKIDQSFISEIAASEDDAPIVAAIVAMAHSLQLTTVAEGVETPEQLACLYQHGCEEVQGFLLSRPLPGDRLLELLADPGGMLEPAGSVAGSLSEAEQAFMGLVADTSRPADGSDRVGPVLRELKRVTGAEVVFVTEVRWQDMDQELRFTTPGDFLVDGTRMSWPGSPCCEMLRGGERFIADLPARFPDHDLVRVYGVTSLTTVPLVTGDGTVYGTLCAAGRGRGSVDETSVVLMELFARLLVEHVGGDDRLTQILAAPATPHALAVGQ